MAEKEKSSKDNKESKDNFMWHKVSESEREEIRKQAEKIMSEFGEKLEKIGLKEKKDELHEHFISEVSGSEEGLREEGEGWETDETFREIFFENAPYSENEFLIGEKGKWREQ